MEHALCEARLASIDALLTRVRLHASVPDTPAAESCGTDTHADGRASADHWLTTAQSGRGAGQACSSGDDGNAGGPGELQLDSAQVQIRVLAHANQELLVRGSCHDFMMRRHELRAPHFVNVIMGGASFLVCCNGTFAGQSLAMVLLLAIS